MLQVTSFLLVLSLALVAPGQADRKCVLKGKWINDLNSTMEIKAVNKDGSFYGTYNTSVSDTSDKIKESPLQGYQNCKKESGQPVFGFTVNWTFADSVSVFTGQYFVDKKGKEILKTMWLLRSHVDNSTDDWKATRVGTNIFTRLPSQKE